MREGGCVLHRLQNKQMGRAGPRPSTYRQYWQYWLLEPVLAVLAAGAARVASLRTTHVRPTKNASATDGLGAADLCHFLFCNFVRFFSFLLHAVNLSSSSSSSSNPVAFETLWPKINAVFSPSGYQNRVVDTRLWRSPFAKPGGGGRGFRRYRFWLRETVHC